jgi:anti-anti-sigma factor
MTESRKNGRRWSFRTFRSRHDGVLVLASHGRVGATSAPALRTELVNAIEEGNRRLVIDLEHVDYVSSAGLHVLSDARRRLDELDGRLVLCVLAEPVRLALELAGLTGAFAIEASRDLAVARCAAEPDGPPRSP